MARAVEAILTAAVCVVEVEAEAKAEVPQGTPLDSTQLLPKLQTTTTKKKLSMQGSRSTRTSCLTKKRRLRRLPRRRRRLLQQRLRRRLSMPKAPQLETSRRPNASAEAGKSAALVLVLVRRLMLERCKSVLLALPLTSALCRVRSTTLSKSMMWRIKVQPCPFTILSLLMP